ncbi:MAG: nuclear transport factor 2 family protein [Pseudomonadota bacterium]
MQSMPLEITNFFLAMQAGPHGLERLGAMFAPDAEYTEPFSGQAGPHKGRDAIMGAFDASRSGAFDDALVQLGTVEVQDEKIMVSWTCFSEAIPGGRGSGTNEFHLVDGKITKLITQLDMGGPQ